MGFTGHVLNLDSLTYAGDLTNLTGVEDRLNYEFMKGDIRDRDYLNFVFTKNEIDTVIHFAAESHVDNSISGPRIFAETNVMGTFELLTAARGYWQKDATRSDTKIISGGCKQFRIRCARAIHG